MLAAGVDRLVFSSTAAVYGEPTSTPIEEDAALAPTNAYGESKLLVEHMLTWMNRIHGLRYASLRYFNVAGAVEGRGEAHEPESHLIPLILDVALGRRQSIKIFGKDYPTPDGTCIRDYVHVGDLADAHILALEALATHSRLIYNIGNGQGFSVREVVESVRRVTGHPIPVVEEPRRPGDPAVLVASSKTDHRRTRVEAAVQRAGRHRALGVGVASAALWKGLKRLTARPACPARTARGSVDSGTTVLCARRCHLPVPAQLGALFAVAGGTAPLIHGKESEGEQYADAYSDHDDDGHNR